MIKHTNSDSTQSCINCAKNCNLIKKYEELIKLYKKKQVKLSLVQSSPNRCTSHTFDSLSTSNSCIKLTEVLTDLIKKRCNPLFRPIEPKPVMKFLILSIFNRLSKSAKMKAFGQLKQVSNSNCVQFVQLLRQKIYRPIKQAFTTIKNFTGNSAIQQIISDFVISQQQYEKNILLSVDDIINQCKHSNNGIKWIQRRNIQLQIENKKLSNENKILKKCMEEVVKRQTKQNQKKKDSLSMLAQQIYEKNQEIHQLKQSLKAYEQTYKPNNNILQDDMISMRKDLDHLESVRQRLNNDLDKIMAQLDQTNKTLKLISKKNEELQKQNYEIKKLTFDLDMKKAKVDISHQQLLKLTKIIDKKIKKLNIYQRQLELARLNNSQTVLNKQSENIQQQLKSDVIFMFLHNISQSQYNLLPQNLFNQDEKNLLLRHKDSWLKTLNQQNSKQTEEKTGKIYDDLDLSQINIKGCYNMESIFNALESPRNSPTNNLTMKLLQLEIEKNRQVEKISEIKEKVLHIRVIILRLLKSLEIQQGIKPQSDDILRILFDLFEYSEEERESIFVKKKKFFGFI